jgi:cell wall-associated NlpC family hydrolase
VLQTVLIGLTSLIVLAPATVAHAEPTLAEIEAQLDKSKKDLAVNIEAWNKTNIDIADSQAKAAALQAKLKPLEDGVAAAGASVEGVAIAAFKTSGNLRSVSIMLSAQSSGALMDRLSTLQQLSRQQQQEITGYKTAKAKFDTEKQQLDQTLAAQNAQKTDLENQRKTIEAAVKKLQDLQRRATNAGSTNVTAPGNTNAKAPVIGDAARQKVVNFAYAQLGKPYKWGAEGPGSYDCSGLTMQAWKTAGVTLPHNAAQQWGKVAHIGSSELQPGDLIFYDGLGHVGIYVKPGTMVHAPSTGDVVKESPIRTSGVYGYGRPKV